MMFNQQFLVYSLLVWLSVTMVTLSSNVVAAAAAGESDADSSPVVDLAQRMIQEEIIPNLIDGIGSVDLHVKFPSGAISRHGNQLTTFAVQHEPNVSWESEPGAYYTLIFADPDAPSRSLPLAREVFHWLVVNIQNSDISTGDTIFGFRPSGPPWLTGLHRYVFYLFKQPAGRIDFGVKTDSVWNRIGSSTKSFAQKYQLGQPIGGNFYLAKYGSDQSIN